MASKVAAPALKTISIEADKEKTDIVISVEGTKGNKVVVTLLESPETTAVSPSVQ